MKDEQKLKIIQTLDALRKEIIGEQTYCYGWFYISKNEHIPDISYCTNESYVLEASLQEYLNEKFADHEPLANGTYEFEALATYFAEQRSFEDSVPPDVPAYYQIDAFTYKLQEQ